MITTIAALQSISAPGPLSGANVSSVIAYSDFTVYLRITGFSAPNNSVNSGARIVLEESTNGFATVTPLFVLDQAPTIIGSSQDCAEVNISIRRWQLPTSVIGYSNAELRVNVYTLNGGGTLTLSAWINSADLTPDA